MCTNTESYYMPTRYDYRRVEIRCGNTKPDGTRAICDHCRNDFAKMAEIERHERNVEADNAWAHSAGWGDF